MKTIKVRDIKALIELENGKTLNIVQEVFELSEPQKGRFLERYKISLIAFPLGDKENKILIDSHDPKSTHIHYGEEEKPLTILKSLDDLYSFFCAEIESHFGKAVDGQLEIFRR